MTSKYISQEVRQQLAKEVEHRCGYCLSDELLSGIPLTIEHIIPTAKGGSNRLGNYRSLLIKARRRWKIAGWHPPPD